MTVSLKRPVTHERPVSLEESYERCKELNKRYGTTYYWSTFALPRIKRHHVWALYAFCRYADDIVDDLGDASTDERRAALTAFGDRFFADWKAGSSDDPVLKAVVHTVCAFGHDPDTFKRFLNSMAMDLTIASYETWDDLCGYMDGSAAVIGEMMLPILEPLSPAAMPHARDLGIAFQLTNFLRDVEEDMQRGRVYIPAEDLRRFGADPHRRVVDDAWVQLMKFEINRCRDLYRSADLGVALLPPASARCVGAARTLYSEILERIETAGYDVFAKRAVVPLARKIAIGGRLAMPRRAG